MDVDILKKKKHLLFLAYTFIHTWDTQDDFDTKTLLVKRFPGLHIYDI